MPQIPQELAIRWRLHRAVYLGARLSTTWRAERGLAKVVVKHADDQALPDWPYQIEFMESMRRAGWPVPELLAEDRVPRAAQWPADGCLRSFTRRRIGFPALSEVVADPELEAWLGVHERRVPEEGALLRECRQAVLERFASCELTAAPMCVIHGDFAPWNLLFDGGRLSGVLDFEGCHYNLKVADFALAWRGGLDLAWPIGQLRRRSALLIARFGESHTYGASSATRVRH
ncbi:aminoglycoside phosphotransferase family protein [Trebonia sp.]|uniref:phosphotransferase n=1 Tax=Trebonia sp. TaxID=2767075 RepID=UPI00261687C8|nr:aminoglycoside phosphotransferase family protein [Trebonia sp.]